MEAVAEAEAESGYKKWTKEDTETVIWHLLSEAAERGEI